MTSQPTTLALAGLTLLSAVLLALLCAVAAALLARADGALLAGCQKLVLAHRGVGDLKQALHNIDIARTTGTSTPRCSKYACTPPTGRSFCRMRRARDDGLSVLGQAAQVAQQYGLSHQLRSIEGIRKGQQG